MSNNVKKQGPPLAHIHIFPWSDTNPRTKVKANITKSDLAKFDKNFTTFTNKLKNGFIYATESGGLRLSEGVAKLCAAYVRAAILSGKYDSTVPRLSKRWADYKAANGLSPHIGVATAEMASTITHFRTNIGEEKNHTGFVVGIRDQTKTGKSAKGGKLTLSTISNSAKLAWLESGTGPKGGMWQGSPGGEQPARPILKLAVDDFLKTTGFIGNNRYSTGKIKVKAPKSMIKELIVPAIKAEMLKALLN